MLVSLDGIHILGQILCEELGSKFGPRPEMTLFDCSKEIGWDWAEGVSVEIFGWGLFCFG